MARGTFFAQAAKISGTSKRRKLGDIYYFLLREFITEVIYVLRGHIHYLQNKNLFY